MQGNIIEYIYGIADNTLILGQRLSELCGHGPNLETDIAMTNIALDLLGQTRSYYQYAVTLHEDANVTEDTIAFLRRENQYRNVLLVETLNYNFAYTIIRQFFFDVYHVLFLKRLQHSKDETLAAIAEKSIKEAMYHFRFSADWVRRLGDGTEESHKKVQEAVDSLWSYTGELFDQTATDKIVIAEEIGVETTILKDMYHQKVNEVLTEATLILPDITWFHKGGKQGIHTEHFGYLLSDMQFMQRAYSGLEW